MYLADTRSANRFHRAPRLKYAAGAFRVRLMICLCKPSACAARNAGHHLAIAGLGQLDQTMPATITLTAGVRSVVITIDAITGKATVGGIQ
jgi:hypothetical protein